MKRQALWTIASIAVATSLFGFMYHKPTESSTAAYAWLAGSWVGDGFGGTSHESWTEPAPDGSMVCAYRHLKGDGSLNFYELVVLDEKGMHLKHFTPELKGWEEKDEVVHFPMVSIEENRIVMEGLTYELTSENTLEIKLRMKRRDGYHTEVFQMTRQ